MYIKTKIPNNDSKYDIDVLISMYLLFKLCLSNINTKYWYCNCDN